MGTIGSRTRRRVTVAGLLLLSALATARADLDVTIANNTVVSAELDPADETETFRFTIASGSKVAITLKAKTEKKETAPAFSVVVLDQTDNVVATGVAKKRTVKVRGFEPSESGEYRVVVTGDGVNTGAYQLKAKWKSPTRSKATIALVEGGASHAFAAAPGSRISVKVAAGKRSPALPRLLAVHSLDDVYQFAEFAEPKASATSHKQGKITVAGQREYLLDFENVGAVGDIVVDVKLVPPKLGKAKVDLRNEAIGGGATPGASGGKPLAAFGGVIGAQGGSVGIGAGLGGLLAGTGLVVPAGALTAPTAIAFGEAINDFPSPNGVVQPLGPAVFFGPEGLAFSEPALCTIPFDFEMYGGELEDIEVYARDEDGMVYLIPPPYVFDLLVGTCTFPVSHFTSFRVFAPPQTVFLQNEIPFATNDGVSGDRVGASIALEGTTLVIGAPEADLDGTGEGAAYVYTRDAKGWGLADKLTASDASSGDGFGTAVALEGTTIVVGAPRAAERTTRPGAVYVFESSQGSWFETQRLRGSSAADGGEFGAAVDIDGGTIVASAPGETQQQSLASAGAVYVFEPVDGFLEEQRIAHSGPAAGERFGAAIALDGETLVVGAPGDGVGGRAFVFDYDGQAFSQSAELLHGEASGEEDFGHAVALRGDLAVVTDPLFDDSATSGQDTGRSFVFRNDAGWSLEKTLASPTVESGSRFGATAAITGAFVIVGHPRIDRSLTDAGAIHVFQDQSGTWPKILTRSADTPGLSQAFGSALAVSGTTVAVGEPGSAGTPGAAYLYLLFVDIPIGDR